MFTTRRKLTRGIFAGSLATVTAPGFTRAKHGAQSKERDIGVTEFLMEWAELAHWREVRQHLAGPMHNSVMLAMSRKYVRDYYERCGEVPTGAHRVSYHCGSDPGNDVQHGTHMYLAGANHEHADGPPGSGYPGKWGFNEWHDQNLDYHFRGIIERIPESSRSRR